MTNADWPPLDWDRPARLDYANAESLLDALVNLWITPGIGWGQIQDMLDALVARRGLVIDSPNSFSEETLGPSHRYNAHRALNINPDRIQALRLEGMTFREIAKELGCSVGTVHRYLRDYSPRKTTPGKLAYEGYTVSSSRERDRRYRHASGYDPIASFVER